jgi:molybdenum cofactor guanylyltransferase
VADPPTLGIVLAGGRATRMGGDDKTRIRVGGVSILERTLERLAPQCAALLINANEPERFTATRLPVVADTFGDFAGPLAGILAGLDWMAANARDIGWLVSVSGDAPFLPRDLVARLHQARDDAGATTACARSNDIVHPVAALWPVTLRDDLRVALGDGVRRVREFAARYPLAFADWPATPVDPFFNINTPEDLAEAERLARVFPKA